MQTLQAGWDFFQNEVLDMKWLNRLIGSIVEDSGLDPTGKVGGSVQFFFCHVIKIMVVLGGTFSFLISFPMVDLGSLVLMMRIFGWKVAIAFMVIPLAGGPHTSGGIAPGIRSAGSFPPFLPLWFNVTCCPLRCFRYLPLAPIPV